jgi:outer membrane receptor protein involved in Fe transport
MVQRMLPTFTAQGMPLAAAEAAAQKAAEAAVAQMGITMKAEMGVPETFRTPQANFAVFHESAVTLAERLKVALGLRLNVDRTEVDYNSMAYMAMTGGTANATATYTLTSKVEDRLTKTYTQLLPKVALTWLLQDGRGNIYALAAKGYRSGGYNIQMFSDILQTELNANQQKAMRGDYDVEHTAADYRNIEETIAYKPEESWNFEVGTHLNLFGSAVHADVALYYMNIRNQQVSKMTAGGLGRIIENSGKSRSAGLEASLRAMLTDDLSLDAAYGFTHAKFRNDEQHTFVPFVPRHTFSVGATQQWTLNAGAWLDTVSLHADYRGAGRIYWTEDNNAWQNFAGSLNARLSVTKKNTELSLYAHNILSTRFQTFYFETMKRAFAQYTRPLELGLQLRLRF